MLQKLQTKKLEKFHTTSIQLLQETPTRLLEVWASEQIAYQQNIKLYIH